MSEEENKQEDPATQTKSKTDNGKTCAVLAYFAIGILWYFLDESLSKNEFAKFHVKQALGLILADVLIMAALFVSIIGWFIIPLMKFVVIAFAIIGIVNALNGEKRELPLIGAYSLKYLKF